MLYCAYLIYIYSTDIYEAEAERLHGVLHLLIFLFFKIFIYIFILFGQTEHRIEDTRSQVQYPRHQSLRTLIKTMKIIRHTHTHTA